MEHNWNGIQSQSFPTDRLFTELFGGRPLFQWPAVFGPLALRRLTGRNEAKQAGGVPVVAAAALCGNSNIR